MNAEQFSLIWADKKPDKRGILPNILQLELSFYMVLRFAKAQERFNHLNVLTCASEEGDIAVVYATNASGKDCLKHREQWLTATAQFLHDTFNRAFTATALLRTYGD